MCIIAFFLDKLTFDFLRYFFVRFSNGLITWIGGPFKLRTFNHKQTFLSCFQTIIWNLDHSPTRYFWTIWIPDLSEIQMSTKILNFPSLVQQKMCIFSLHEFRFWPRFKLIKRWQLSFPKQQKYFLQREIGFKKNLIFQYYLIWKTYFQSEKFNMFNNMCVCGDWQPCSKVPVIFFVQARFQIFLKTFYGGLSV